MSLTRDKSEERANKKLEKSKKRAEAKKHLPGGIASLSFLIALFDRICNIICDAIVKGFFGRLCSGYKKCQQSFENGFLREFLFSDRKFKKFFRRVRKFLSRNLETCFIVTRGQRAIKFFASAPLSFYGGFGVLFGLYTVVVYFVRMLVPDIPNAPIDYIIVAAAVVIVSIPLVFSKLPFSAAIMRSTAGKLIFQSCFGVSDETLIRNSSDQQGKGTLMLFLGLIAGTLTFFVHPLAILFSILAIAVIFFVAVTPEIGVVLTLFAVPFCSFVDNPTVLLCSFVGLTAFFYLIKLIRGKRVIKLEAIDVAVLIFAILMLLSSIFSAGGAASATSAVVTCILLIGYFLIVNLMRTEKWIKRCVAALVSSATIVAFLAIVENFFGVSDNRWIDVALFSDIRIRVASLFENPNVLATYLVLILPFVFAYMTLSKTLSEKILSSLVCVIFVTAIVFTWSRAAWLATIVATFFFFTVYSRKTLRVIGLGLICAPAIPMLVPETVINRFISIINLSDSSISYRIYTWLGSMRVAQDNFIGGIGYGLGSFSEVYPSYAYAGIEAAEHSHSLYLQVIISMGIGGLLTLAVICFLHFQKCSEYIQKPENKASKFFVSASVMAIMAGLIMGIFDYVWYNYRVFYIFWIVLAIGCAFVRIGNNEAIRRADPIEEYSISNSDNFNEERSSI